MNYLWISIALAVCLAGENEYLIDEPSILKTNYKWTMILLHKRPTKKHMFSNNNYLITKANAIFESLDI